MDSVVESTPPPPVKNLRSKFEQLANCGPTSTSRPTTSAGLLTAPEAHNSPLRPRAASGNSQKCGDTSLNTHHLRLSSSSSDLRAAGDSSVAALKRPPPPPPRSRPGNSPTASPGLSPLLRPVPAPPLSSTVTSPRSGAASLPTSYDLDDGHGESLNVKALRNKLSNASTASDSASTPKLGHHGLPLPDDDVSNDPQLLPKVSALREKFGRSTSTSTLLRASNDTMIVIPPRPVIPPRFPRISDVPTPVILSPSLALTYSPDENASSPASIASLASKDPLSLRARTPSPSTPTNPPALPARKLPYSVYNHTAGGSESTSSIASSTRSLHSNSSQWIVSATNTGSSSNTSSTEGSGIASAENDSGLPLIPARQSPPRSGVIPPPRPPPRYRVLASPNVTETPLPASNYILPPPLPIRRAASPIPLLDPLPPPPSAPSALILIPPRPPLPSRPANHTKSHTTSEISVSPTSERKTLTKLPPPPTRTIGLGDKLPPPRRPPTPSSEDESAAEDDDVLVSATGVKSLASQSHGSASLEALPDTSQTSRRPPHLLYRENYPEPRVAVPAHVGQAVVSGTNIVVGTGHGLRVYDVGISDGPIKSMDGKELGISAAVANGGAGGGAGKENLKVTSMEMKGMGTVDTAGRGMRGNLAWIGTKEGHLFEMDVRTGQVYAAKFSAHLSPVVYIGRYERTMVSVDEGGKVLIFQTEGNEEASLLYTQPRVLRIGEKHDFIRLVGRKLWAASRGDHQHAAVTPGGSAGANGVGHGGSLFSATTKLPILKIFDIFNPGIPVKSIVPTEHVGAVLCATIIPSNPTYVYVGHEEGYTSTWNIETEECLEVTKVSTSDVLCVEGVNDKLWSGSRNGVISVYDVSCKPWIVTNSWMAHGPGLPVLKLMVDVWGIEKTGRLAVVSIGRDEVLRLWDGLLGTDWIEQELWKQEHAFTKARELSVLLVSWNIDAAKPETLTGDPANLTFFNDVLQSVPYPDVISFGFQEVMDLENRKMAAKNVLLGGAAKKGKNGAGGNEHGHIFHHHHHHADGQAGGVGMNGSAGGGLSEKVTSSYKRWYDKLLNVVRIAFPDVQYSVVATQSLVGLFSCVFVKNSERQMLKDVNITTIKRGMGGRYGNKGGIVARFVIDDTSVCLINCHLAAGQNAVRQRNADVTAMLEERTVFPVTSHPVAYVGGGDGSMVLDHEIVFVSGDMNYRIDHRRDAIISLIQSGDIESLLVHDQLLREIKFNRACRFRGFSEGPITFHPTYKYDRRSHEYDTSEKRRAPAWCDRVLWKSRVAERVRQLNYQRWEPNVSDHRPISAGFLMNVKSVKHDVRERILGDVKVRWGEEQKRLLIESRVFYMEQGFL